MLPNSLPPLELSLEVAERLRNETFSESWDLLEKHVLQHLVAAILDRLVNASDPREVAFFQGQIRCLSGLTESIRQVCEPFRPKSDVGDEDVSWSGYSN